MTSAVWTTSIANFIDFRMFLSFCLLHNGLLLLIIYKNLKINTYWLLYRLKHKMSVKNLSDLHFYPNCRTDSKMVPICLFYYSVKCFVPNTAKKHNPGYWYIPKQNCVYPSEWGIVVIITQQSLIENCMSQWTLTSTQADHNDCTLTSHLWAKVT